MDDKLLEIDSDMIGRLKFKHVQCIGTKYNKKIVYKYMMVFRFQVHITDILQPVSQWRNGEGRRQVFLKFLSAAISYQTIDDVASLILVQ
jgi:hypothetical protein